MSSSKHSLYRFYINKVAALLRGSVIAETTELSATGGTNTGMGWNQGFMQDKIIASHTCFGGHVDVNC